MSMKVRDLIGIIRTETISNTVYVTRIVHIYIYLNVLQSEESQIASIPQYSLRMIKREDCHGMDAAVRKFNSKIQ